MIPTPPGTPLTHTLFPHTPLCRTRWGNPSTPSAACRRQPNRRKPMKSIAILAKSLLLSLVLTASAFAADKVNINTADATAIADPLTGVGKSKAEALEIGRASGRESVCQYV